jgi:hypothetical protein
MAAALLLLAACGDGEPIIRDAAFLPVYRYELRQDADSPGSLELAVTWEGSPHVFSVRFAGATGMTGLIDSALGVTSIAPGSELSAETSFTAGPVAAFRFVVSAEIELAPTGEFSAGAWRVIAGEDTIRVEIVPGGVELSLNDGASSFFGWPDFTALFAPGTAVPGWQQAASASFQFLLIATLQTRMVFVALSDAARVSFTNTPDVQACSAFPVGPPDGVLNQGERVLTWLGSANLGFNWRFTDCWTDLAGSDQDYLYRGEIALTGWRASNDLRNRLVFIGFGGDQFGARVPGGVSYMNLGLARTVSGPSGVSSLDPAAQYTVSGGFAASFVAP